MTQAGVIEAFSLYFTFPWYTKEMFSITTSRGEIFFSSFTWTGIEGRNCKSSLIEEGFNQNNALVTVINEFEIHIWILERFKKKGELEYCNN